MSSIAIDAYNRRMYASFFMRKNTIVCTEIHKEWLFKKNELETKKWIEFLYGAGCHGRRTIIISGYGAIDTGDGGRKRQWLIPRKPLSKADTINFVLMFTNSARHLNRDTI